MMELDHAKFNTNITIVLSYHVNNDLTFLIKSVIKITWDVYGYVITYEKAWFSLKRVVEKVYAQSCQYANFYILCALQKHNLRTVMKWQHMQGPDQGI